MKRHTVMRRVLALAFSFALACGMFPAGALAELAPAGVPPLSAQGAGELRPLPAPVGGSVTVTEDGRYEVPADAVGVIYISPGLSVELVGQGSHASDHAAGLAVSCGKGVSLTLRDIALIAASDGSDAGSQPYHNIDFPQGSNVLTIAGEVLVERDTNATGYCAIHVPSSSSLLVNGSGTLWLYKREQGAGIGGAAGELNGALTFGNPLSPDGSGGSSLHVYAKGSKQGAVIGSGAASSGSVGQAGDIAFNSGTYDLVANARGALVGGSAGSGGAQAGGKVRVAGGILSLNVDFSGSAIGGGGYAEGNDSDGGIAYLDGGSVRAYVDANAVSSWSARGVSREGADDRVITAVKTSSALGASDSDKVALLAFDTRRTEAGASLSESYAVQVDGSPYGSLALHAHRYVNQSLLQGSQLEITDTRGNWEWDTYDGTATGAPSDPFLYLYLPIYDAAGNRAAHAVSCGGFTMTCSYNPETGRFEEGFPVEPSAVAGGALSASPLVAKAGDTVTLSPVPDFGNAVASVTAQTSPSDGSPGEEVALTAGDGGAFTFTMPAAFVKAVASFEVREVGGYVRLDLGEGDLAIGDSGYSLAGAQEVAWTGGYILAGGRGSRVSVDVTARKADIVLSNADVGDIACADGCTARFGLSGASSASSVRLALGCDISFDSASGPGSAAGSLAVGQGGIRSSSGGEGFGLVEFAGGSVTVAGGMKSTVDGPASVGSGSRSSGGGKVVVSGGRLEAQSNSHGPAIGSGRSSSVGVDVEITGGEVVASGYFDDDNWAGGSAAIGSGANAACGDVVISGGRVSAWGNWGGYEGQLIHSGPAIGSGSGAPAGGSVKVMGGSVEAHGDESGWSSSNPGATDSLATDAGAPAIGRAGASGGVASVTVVGGSVATFGARGFDPAPVGAFGEPVFLWRAGAAGEDAMVDGADAHVPDGVADACVYLSGATHSARVGGSELALAFSGEDFADAAVPSEASGGFFRASGSSGADVSVRTASGGSAAASAARADAGDVVVVTVLPDTDRRPGLSASAEDGSTVAVERTGARTFAVEMPASGAAVALEPSFPEGWEIGAECKWDVLATLVDGTLTVSGQGPTPRYAVSGHVVQWAPWYKRRGEIVRADLTGLAGAENLDYWFYQCWNLASAEGLPEGVESMAGTFLACTKLAEPPVLPSTVTDLRECFKGCSALVTAPALPACLKSMAYAFAECAFEEPPDIPEGVEDVSYAFYYNRRIARAAELPASVTSAERVFARCFRLTEPVAIPATADATGAFAGCAGITCLPTGYSLAWRSSTGAFDADLSALGNHAGALLATYALEEGIDPSAASYDWKADGRELVALTHDRAALDAEIAAARADLEEVVASADGEGLPPGTRYAPSRRVNNLAAACDAAEEVAAVDDEAVVAAFGEGWFSRAELDAAQASISLARIRLANASEVVPGDPSPEPGPGEGGGEEPGSEPGSDPGEEPGAGEGGDTGAGEEPSSEPDPSEGVGGSPEPAPSEDEGIGAGEGPGSEAGSGPGSGGAAPAEPAAVLQMHRLYNPNSGEHFYTASDEERDGVVAAGWHYEGVGWTAPERSSTPVYRLYNPNAGEHHYTTDAKERDVLVGEGWKYEGIGWYSDDAEAVPLYRQYNPNAFACNHNYTASKEESDWLVSLGWKYEGIAWHGAR